VEKKYSKRKFPVLAIRLTNETGTPGGEPKCSKYENERLGEK
jgi:hypothetical protein